MSRDGETVGWRVGETVELENFGKFRVLALDAKSPRTGETIIFKIIDRAPSVIVIPFTDDGRVITVKQFRPGIQSASIELPAGLLDHGEEPVEGARRELEEETGYKADNFEIVGEVFHDPAILTSKVTFIAAHGCKPVGERNQDEAEDVHTQLFSADEIDAMIARGQIRHAVVIAAWLMAKQA
jgi:8-oxo-dGTP pyrophosphatase MutT (NUDIX family)